jgi:hypothetical protein
VHIANNRYRPMTTDNGTVEPLPIGLTRDQSIWPVAPCTSHSVRPTPQLHDDRNTERGTGWVCHVGYGCCPNQYTMAHHVDRKTRQLPKSATPPHRPVDSRRRACRFPSQQAAPPGQGSSCCNTLRDERNWPLLDPSVVSSPVSPPDREGILR